MNNSEEYRQVVEAVYEITQEIFEEARKIHMHGAKMQKEELLASLIVIGLGSESISRLLSNFVLLKLISPDRDN